MREDLSRFRAATSVKKPVVLVVDDSPVLLRNVKEMLGNRYDVMLAPSGPKALSMMGKKCPDVVLLDYEMPECDGKETFKMIRDKEEFAHVLIVFLTGNDSADHIGTIQSLDPDGYVIKPASVEKLTDAIEAAIKGKN
ncbi:MAG: response regulator [Lachnospiraceae bacterium]|nr:response regulator [Lachnospiraceae bacterium]